MAEQISIVIPVHNEEACVAAVHAEVKALCEAQGYTYEIIIVDDGSTDRTAAICRGLAPVRLVCLRTNFGQTAALDAGMKQARYARIVTLDGDGQNNPQDIPRLLAHMEAHQLDVVSGWRRQRRDPAMKRFISRWANVLRRFFVVDRIHDSGCTLKVYRRECLEHLDLYGEMHRFIPGLLAIKGYRIGELEVDHRPRSGGRTKYNWMRMVKGFLDMLAVYFWRRYAYRPLHLFGTIGLVLLAAGGVFSGISVVEKLGGQDLSQTMEPMLAVFFLLMGGMLIALGLVADIVAKLYYGLTRDYSYSIREIVEND